jgi:tetratricopeptide (TPR) repeat protein
MLAHSRRHAAPVVVALLVLSGLIVPAVPAAPDTIVLTNGRVIEADRAWYDGAQVRYEKNGGVYGLPRAIVKSVDQRALPEPAGDPDVTRGRELLAAHDPVPAIRLFKLALSRNGSSLSALHGLTEAYLAMGDPRAAQQWARKAVVVDDRDPRSRTLLGDVLSALGDRAGAEAEYRRSLLLRPDPDVQRKLGDVAPAPARAAGGAQFRLKYDGGVNEPMGKAVLQALTQAYAEYSKRLGFNPEEPVTVVLQVGALHDPTVPEWAAGVNDGTIRVPIGGLDEPTPSLLTVLRHELAHSFIAARTGGNCPTWLQEGVSQWLEGGDPNREDAAVAALAKSGQLHPLITLEAPFQGLSATEAPLAYAESLSAVAHILRKRGEPGVIRLLSALGDRIPSEEALPVALALSYPEFQKSWEEYLRSERK